jgi:ribulose-5-phosphate 4-epimerase/fuculose-1-phosphate aldolase
MSSILRPIPRRQIIW